MRKVLVVSLMIVLAQALGGCSSTEPVESQRNSGLLANLSPLQQEVLRDKKVTLAEYQKAVDATVTCLESNGFEILDRTVDNRTGEITFGSSHDVAAANDAKANADVDATMRHCERLSLAVSNVYLLQWLPTAEERDRAPGVAADCLKATGIDVAGSGVPDVEKALKQAVAIDATDPRREAAKACSLRYFEMSKTSPPGLEEEWKAYQP